MFAWFCFHWRLYLLLPDTWRQLAPSTQKEPMETTRLWVPVHYQKRQIRSVLQRIESFEPMTNQHWTCFPDEPPCFITMILLLQSKETFRALLRTDTGESIPFSTLYNRSQVYRKLTGRRLASARLNFETWESQHLALLPNSYWAFETLSTFWSARITTSLLRQPCS